MITRVQAKNFRSVSDVDVELGPLTVLVGKNGAGKSSFVDIIRFTRDALRGDVAEALARRGGFSAVRHRSAAATGDEIRISLGLRTPDLTADYSFSVGAGRGGEGVVTGERCRVEPGAGAGDSFETQESVIASPPRELTGRSGVAFAIADPSRLLLPSVAVLEGSPFHPVWRYLTRAGCYAVFPDSLRPPQKPSRRYPLTDNADNLASVLSGMAESGSRWLPDLNDTLERITEDVVGHHVIRVGDYLVTQLAHRAGSGTTEWFDVAQESDGTLRTLALLAAVYQDSQLSLVAVEEPELTIHPGALAVLADTLAEAALRMQIVITTQSPDLISRFNAEQLRVVERVSGVTRIGPLAEYQRATIDRQLFSAGDLLRIEGLAREPVKAAAGSHG